MSYVNLGRNGYVTQDSTKYVGFSSSTLQKIVTTSTTSTSVTLSTGTSNAVKLSPFSSIYDPYNHDFNGSTGYKFSPMYIEPNSNFTMECWINVYGDLAANTSYYIFARRESSGLYSPFDLEIRRETVNYMRFRMLGTSNAGTSWSFITFGTARVSQNTWYHIAFVKNGTAARFYINGVQDISGTYGSATLSINPDYGYLGILNNAGTFINGFNGQISNFRFTPSAVYTAGFTPPSVPWSSIGSSLFYTPLSARGPRGITLNT